MFSLPPRESVLGRHKKKVFFFGGRRSYIGGLIEKTFFCTLPQKQNARIDYKEMDFRARHLDMDKEV